MKKISLYSILMLMVSMFVLTSCSETEEGTSEYSDWQNQNETYFDSIYNVAKTQIAAGSTDWKIIRNWSLNDGVATKTYDNVVVKVVTAGTGTANPLYTDTVKIQFQGRLKPSPSYPEGYVFDKTFTGDYNPLTAAAVKRPVAGTYKVGTTSVSIPDGLTTALMSMTVGNRVIVYIPYQLGYGTTANTTLSIPAYSTLIYDVTLVAFARVGTIL